MYLMKIKELFPLSSYAYTCTLITTFVTHCSHNVISFTKEKRCWCRYILFFIGFITFNLEFLTSKLPYITL